MLTTSPDQALREINSEAKYVFIEAEVSLINEVDKACKQILSVESRVDYLCMSTGYFPMVGAIGEQNLFSVSPLLCI